MRFGNLAERLVLITADGAIDAAEASGGAVPSDPQEALEVWDEVLSWASSAETRPVPFDQTDLGAPVPRPRQVFALALNYADHASEGGVPIPEYPITFTKYPTCITGPFAEVALSSERVDWELELVVVLGRVAHRVAVDDAWDFVAGLTVGQDLSDRGVQHRKPAPQFSLGKSFPGYGPLGPVLVTPDEFTSIDDLQLQCTLNGEVVQSGRTSDLVFSVPQLISELSAIVPLQPGDVIFTGTPAGVGMSRTPPQFLAPGDVLESSIEGIGTIRTTFAVTAPLSELSVSVSA